MRMKTELPHNTETYQIGPDKWQRIKDSAAGFGFQITTDAGQGESFGVTLKWEWNAHRHTLYIVIVESGILAPAEALNFVDGIIQAA